MIIGPSHSVIQCSVPQVKLWTSEKIRGLDGALFLHENGFWDTDYWLRLIFKTANFEVRHWWSINKEHKPYIHSDRQGHTCSAHTPSHSRPHTDVTQHTQVKMYAHTDMGTQGGWEDAAFTRVVQWGHWAELCFRVPVSLCGDSSLCLSAFGSSFPWGPWNKSVAWYFRKGQSKPCLHNSSMPLTSHPLLGLSLNSCPSLGPGQDKQLRPSGGESTCKVFGLCDHLDLVGESVPCHPARRTVHFSLVDLGLFQLPGVWRFKE